MREYIPKVLIFFLLLAVTLSCIPAAEATENFHEEHTEEPGYVFSDDSFHNLVYTCCDAVVPQRHTGGAATCQARAVCDLCGEAYGPAGGHSPDGSGICSVCGVQVCVPEEEAVVSVRVAGVETAYSNLADAIGAVAGCSTEDGAVVMLKQNIALGADYQLVASGVFTLDLAGKSIGGSNVTGVLFITGGQVTVTDSSEEKSGSIAADAGCEICAVRITGGELILEGGAVNSGSHTAIYAENSRVIIIDGRITAGKYAVHGEADATVTIAGGELTGFHGLYLVQSYAGILAGDIRGINGAGIYAYRSSVTVAGGFVSGVTAVYNLYSTVRINRCTLEASENGIYMGGGPESKLYISGGSIRGAVCDIRRGYASGNDVPTLWLSVPAGNPDGIIFPGGITVADSEGSTDKLTLGRILDAGMGYWVGDAMVIPDTDAVSLTDGGDVVVKPACVHGDISLHIYSDNEDGTHDCVCAGCGLEIVSEEDHHPGYVAEGAAVVARCISCGAHMGDVTVHAEDKTYDGSPAAVHLIKTGILAEEAFSVEYHCDTVLLEEIPVDAGTYTASVHFSGYTAAVTFSIAQRTLTVRADALCKTYGEEDPALTYISEGLVNGDGLTGTLIRGAGENTGTYPILQGTLSAGGNYSLIYCGADFMVNQRSVSVTAQDQRITYGGSISGGDFVSEGLCEGHALSALLTADTSNVTAHGSIIPSGAVITAGTEDVTANYSITYFPGELVIAPDTSYIDTLSEETVTSADKEKILAVLSVLERSESSGEDWVSVEEKCNVLLGAIQRKEELAAARIKADAFLASVEALPDAVALDDEVLEERLLGVWAAYQELTVLEKELVGEKAAEKLDRLMKALTDYAFIEGSGADWIWGSGGSLTFTANGPFRKFVGIKVDAGFVDPAHYEAKAGSTLVTLKQSYLQTLPIGEHVFTVVYTDGEISCNFRVHPAPSSPPTGDAGVWLWMLALVLSTTGMAVLPRTLKVKKQ